MTLAHRIATGLVVLFGAIHIALTPVFFDEFMMRLMWYVAQGLMGVVVGFLNLAAVRVVWRDPVITRLCHLANGLCVLFSLLYLAVDRALPSFIAVGLFLVLSISALVLDRQRAGIGTESTG